MAGPPDLANAASDSDDLTTGSVGGARLRAYLCHATADARAHPFPSVSRAFDLDAFCWEPRSGSR